MSKEKELLGRYQAYPSDYTGNSDREPGISTRLYVACKVAPAIISDTMTNQTIVKTLKKISDETGLSVVELAVSAIYEYVDEILKQEQTTK